MFDLQHPVHSRHIQSDLWSLQIGNLQKTLKRGIFAPLILSPPTIGILGKSNYDTIKFNFF